MFEIYLDLVEVQTDELNCYSWTVADLVEPEVNNLWHVYDLVNSAVWYIEIFPTRW